MTAWRSPDCDVLKHDACSGEAFDDDRDDVVPCACDCHGIRGDLDTVSLDPRLVP